jgi:hypothetical protein
MRDAVRVVAHPGFCFLFSMNRMAFQANWNRRGFPAVMSIMASWTPQMLAHVIATSSMLFTRPTPSMSEEILLLSFSTMHQLTLLRSSSI